MPMALETLLGHASDQQDNEPHQACRRFAISQIIPNVDPTDEDDSQFQRPDTRLSPDLPIAQRRCGCGLFSLGIECANLY